MKQLWAPWRVKYIEGKKAAGCILCVRGKADKDRENLVVHRGKSVFAVLNLYPYNSGHLMVAPFRHVADLKGLSGEELAELVELTRTSTAVLERTYHPEGFNIGMNLGAVAGAGVTDHVHMHVVPRWAQDTNFMPVVGDTKVISQSLEEAYERLVAAWRGNQK